MIYTKEVVYEINEINKLFDCFCNKISNEHHKEMDGVWQIGFRIWTDEVSIHHDGYWLDDIWITVPSKDILKGLQQFKRKVKKKMDKEIDEFDFVNHCGKE